MEHVVPPIVTDNNNNKTSINKSSISKQTDEVQSMVMPENSEATEAVISHRFYYTVGKYNILLEQDIKAENLSQPKIYEIPYPPSWCSGIVNVRGNIIPVVNMHTLLKTEESISTKNSKLLLFQHDSLSPIIFQIDSLPSMINFDEYTSKKLATDAAHWMTGSFQHESNIIYQTDHINLLKNIINNN